MKLIQRIYSYLRSRFSKLQLLILLGVLILGFFVGDSSIFSRISYDRKIKELESKIDYYEKKKEIDKKKLQEVHDDQDRIEKIARENYKMKKGDEDIFIVE